MIIVSRDLDPIENYRKTREQVGWLPRHEAGRQTYEKLGFMSGLEIHQQLKTAGKLFCRCPAGIYHDFEDYDAEVIRHMRPTLSELGEYDGTALMEFKTKKNIVYRVNDRTACTYEIDDTPPFKIDREALDIATEIALMLRTNVVGELHITRKQYLDGSIPTGFQRTAIVGIEGEIPLSNKNIRIIQLSLEEDSCREVSDIGHWRTYSTDRLGMPLVETVTYPDMLTPDECAEAGQYLRFLARASGKVRTGIGAARQDVNVSIRGGTRIEIKGVARIKWIPELTHNEAFRQNALLQIRQLLLDRGLDPKTWRLSSKEAAFRELGSDWGPLRDAVDQGYAVHAVRLPGFRGVLSYFTQPGRAFADELADRIKVIACIERPNMLHEEAFDDSNNILSPNLEVIANDVWGSLRQALEADEDDGIMLVWGPEEDIPMALETIGERCQLAFEGVPNETRKGLSDGTTIFERVLPGPDRMYPDTDSAPLPVEDEYIDRIRQGIAIDVSTRLEQLRDWNVPSDAITYLLSRNLVPLIEHIAADTRYDPRFVGSMLGHRFKHIEGTRRAGDGFTTERLYDLFRFVNDHELAFEVLAPMMEVVYENPNMVLDSALTVAGYVQRSPEQISAMIGQVARKYEQIKRSDDPANRIDWIMGQLRPPALGNIRMADLRQRIEEEVGHE